MRVLFLHNRYRAEGGEERAVADIAALLRGRGHPVEVVERSSADTSRVRAGRALVGGGVDTEEIAALVRRARADVVHAHNLHPLFGWRALAAARSAGCRTVLHLHNFRLFCAISIAFRDGAPCFRCHDRHTLPGLRLRCRGSLAEAAVYAAGLHLQQPHLYEHTDRFLVVSQATAARLRELGLPAARAVMLPNFVPAAQLVARSRADEGSYALVAGRLVEEKGVDTAIRAAASAQVPLVVAGAGPHQARLRRLAAGANVRFTGQLGPRELSDIRTRAAVMLAPSRWEEPCPYAVLDAHAAGVPALVSDRGGLPELVPDGGVLPADDHAAWAGALRALWENPAGRRERGQQALDLARERFNEDRYYERLMAVYGE
jgi:glycosyltransferase involved in cell wall biosynthesis